MAVIEGRYQFDLLAEQHSVAEHIAAHVADAHYGERLGLHIDAEFPEVPLHRFPRTAGGDAHGLVVVPFRTPGRESIAEPEAIVRRDRVGQVRERRGAFVCSHHQIRVVAVPAHRTGRRHDFALHPVVGDVEQTADELRVAHLALRQQIFSGAAVDRVLDDETAFGTHRHDHRVLDLLGFDQAEHLGAEVVAPVTPAQPAAGHIAEPQVHTRGVRREHEDFVLGPRLGHPGDGAWVEFERQPPLKRAVLVHLESVGAQNRRHNPDDLPQDPVVVQARDLVQLRADGFVEGQRVPHSIHIAVRVVPGLEQFDQQGHDVRVPDQRFGERAVAERRADLPGIVHPRLHIGGLAPRQPGARHQPQSEVWFPFAGECGHKRVREALRQGLHVGDRIELAQIQTEVVHIGGAATRPGHGERVLIDHLHVQ